MKKTIVHPLRFVVGPGVVADVGAHAAALGTKAFIVGGGRAVAAIKDTVTGALDEHGIPYHIEHGKHVDKKRPEVDALVAKGRAQGADVVIAAGGGRVVDAAKAIAHEMGAWLISVPTVASTNATATFSASIEGDADRNVWYVGPHTVIADTRIIAQGGGRWLAAGMADALPTWTGGRIARELRLRSGTERILGFDNVFPTGAAVVIAEWTYDTILGYGESAYHACERGAATEAVDKVVEAIVYGGGVAGPACGGVGGEHGVHPGKSRHATIERVHGEEVAFGILVAVTLMQQGEAEVRKLIRFNQSVKLPSTFADFGVQNATRSLVREIAEEILGPGGKSTFGLWYDVDVDLLTDVMVDVDRMAQEELSR